MSLKALMVDVDGVIVAHPDPKGWSAGLERDLGLSAERLEPVLAEIAPQLSAESLMRYWFEHDAHLDHDLLDQLAEFRSEGLQLHLATVQEHRRADCLWRTLGLCDRFDAMHYSADLGWTKPAPEFFSEVERRTGFRPAELFFIDDRAENVAAARACGWRAAVWTGARRLADLMIKDGV